MTETVFLKHRIAVPFAAVAAASVIAVSTAAAASTDGRTLEGNFCSSSHTCMTITFDGATASIPTRTDPTQPDLTLRPGSYWITVTDDSNFHKFSLRSCRGSTSLCTSDNPASGATDQDITPICNDPLTRRGPCPKTNPAANVIVETIKVNLSHGTYRLFCDAPGHEAEGMYVELAVGGVGQVG